MATWMPEPQKPSTPWQPLLTSSTWAVSAGPSRTTSRARVSPLAAAQRVRVALHIEVGRLGRVEKLRPRGGVDLREAGGDLVTHGG